MIMGHEFSGVVAETGAAVTGYAPGDEVIVSPLRHAAKCNCGEAWSTSAPTATSGRGHAHGAFAEQLVVKPSMVYPAGMTWRQGAMVEPLSVGLHAVEITPIRLMDTVVIVGVGTIGLMTLLGAQLKGAGQIIVTDMSEHRLEMARRLGADLCINVAQTDPVAAIREATGGLGADVSFEAVGYAPTVQQAHAVTRTGGNVTWIGNSAQMIELNMQDVVTRELTVRGTYGFNTEFPRAIQAIASGKIDVMPLLEKVAPLEEGPALVDGLAKAELDLIKVILEL